MAEIALVQNHRHPWVLPGEGAQRFDRPVSRGVVDKDVPIIDRLVGQCGGDTLREHADICYLVEAGSENGKRAM